MASKKVLWTMLMLVFSFVASSAWGLSQSRVEGNLLKTSSFSKGSAQYEQVRQFLLQHAENFQKASDFSSFAPGSLTVTVGSGFRNQADLSRIQQDDNPGPPVGLPGGQHQNGDSLEISSCAGGDSQTWSYTWTTSNGGQWVQTGYQHYHLRMCPAPNGGK